MKKKGKKVRSVKRKTKTQRKKVQPSKIFIYALALAALSGGGYLAFDRLRRARANRENASDQDTIIINNNLPSGRLALPQATNSLTKRSSSGSDAFPLKRGSRGTKVILLQQALSKNNPSIQIDGQFGPQTVGALKAAGYPEIVDEATFSQITGSNTRILFNPYDIAARLYRAAQARQADEAINILKEIGTTQEYAAVNDHYKKHGIFISRTIVTDLLDYAFKSDEATKEKIRKEFLRMGLKVNSSGIWTLQGIKLFKDLITLRDTIVVDRMNNRIPVKKNTILGDEVEVSNGMTWFRSVDSTILKVPSRDITYT